ncbi:MAG: hypothetical protein ACO3GP_07190 [Candidatus Limnocylindrus sp.]
MKTTWSSIARDQADKAHKAEVDGLKAKIISYQHTVSDLEQQLGIALSLGKSRIRPQPLAVSMTDKAEAVAVALASDWHVEETVEAASVNGLNEYNLHIAKKRIEKFFTTIARLTEIERHGARIDDLILWLGGDLMTGMIHEELAESNSKTPTQVILWLQDRLADGLATLKPHFQRILIPTSYGNHGRTTQKPRHATGAAHSYEWLLYRILEGRFAADQQIEFQIADSYFNFMTVFDRRLRFHHGDGLKFQGGIGGLTIPTEKAIASWNKSPNRADLDLFGHWHQYQQNRHWLCNGSLIGYNAYALSIKASFEPPTQTYFLLDKKRGRTMTAPIYL